MKKFLSLLLALTLVLSLVVVPARAADGEESSEPAVTVTGLSIAAGNVDRGVQKTFSLAGTPTVTDNKVPAKSARITSCAWTVPNFTGNPGTSPQTATLTAFTPTTGSNTVKVSCVVTVEYVMAAAEGGGEDTIKTVSKVVNSDSFTIADKLLPGDITTVTFKGRTYSVTNGTVNISLLEGEDLKGDNKWSAAATGYVIDNTTNKPTYNASTGKLTVKTTAATPLSTDITVTSTSQCQCCGKPERSDCRR